MKGDLACRVLVIGVLLWSLPAAGVGAGPYTEAGIASNDARIVGWATGWTNLVRGPKDIAYPPGGTATAGHPDNVLGPVTCDVGDTVSLGDGGRLTLTFALPIYDGPGPDLVVFENGFFSGLGLFAELAFVEVSTNGATFARFPGASLTPDPVGTYDTLDPTDVYYLAGKHPGGNQQPCEGTGFDLSSLLNHPAVLSGAVDLAEINYVRVVDVIGNGSTRDSLNNPIYDPYPTNFSNGGFDLQAVGAIHQGACTDEDADDYAVDGGGCGPVDCNDSDPGIHPGASEGPEGDATCSDGKDNDCDGLKDVKDPGCTTGSGGGCSAGTAAEAAGTGNDRQGASGLRGNLLLLFLVASFTVIIRRVRRLPAGDGPGAPSKGSP